MKSITPFNISIKNISFHTLVLSQLLSASVYAQNNSDDHQHFANTIEEIIISGSQNKTKAETALPIHVISGEELRNNAGATLGESIQNQVGVHSSSFGVGVGQPIIRGLTGNRVKVLQNSLSTLDASSTSQDHADSVEALLSEQIEIIRGPATLLYGNGAIGGVVNVIDNRIPTSLAPSSFGGAAEYRHSSGNDNNTLVTKLEGSEGSFSWHVDGVHRDSNLTEIPGFALDVKSIEALEHHDEHEEEHHDEEEFNNTKGFVGNSESHAKNFTLGASWIGENSYFGMAISSLKNNYGIPAGAHHHEEEHEEEEHEEEHQEEEENIRIDMDQLRGDILFGKKFTGIIEELTAQIAFNDYEHQELENTEIGTVFSNRGFDSRLSIKHQNIQGFSGVWGFQYGDREFSAIGEESFIPATDISNLGLFILESVEFDPVIFEFGFRIDKDKIASEGNCDIKNNSWSASTAAIWGVSATSNLSVSLSRAERSPSVEESFSNVNANTCNALSDEQLITHAATQRIELGDANLRSEISNNIEFGLFKYAGKLRAEINLFRNEFDNFIYLADTAEIDEVIVSRYLQNDAAFYGMEAQLSYPLIFANTHHFDITLFGDWVKAELRDGENIPRIPPQRLGLELQYQNADFSTKIRSTTVSDQDEIAAGELNTPGYTRIDAQMDYHLQSGNLSWVLFMKGSNLTNKEIRDHTSLLKNFSPAPGRSFDIGLRLNF